MDDSLNCGRCGQPYGRGDHCPRTLLCGHAFCSLCLKEVIASRRRQCPSCNRSFFSQSVSQLPTDFTLLRKASAAALSVASDVSQPKLPSSSIFATSSTDAVPQRPPSASEIVGSSSSIRVSEVHSKSKLPGTSLISTSREQQAKVSSVSNAEAKLSASTYDKNSQINTQSTSVSKHFTSSSHQKITENPTLPSITSKVTTSYKVPELPLIGRTSNLYSRLDSRLPTSSNARRGDIAHISQLNASLPSRQHDKGSNEGQTTDEVYQVRSSSSEQSGDKSDTQPLSPTSYKFPSIRTQLSIRKYDQDPVNGSQGQEDDEKTPQHHNRLTHTTSLPLITPYSKQALSSSSTVLPKNARSITSIYSQDSKDKSLSEINESDTRQTQTTSLPLFAPAAIPSAPSVLKPKGGDAASSKASKSSEYRSPFARQVTHRPSTSASLLTSTASKSFLQNSNTESNFKSPPSSEKEHSSSAKSQITYKRSLPNLYKHEAKLEIPSSESTTKLSTQNNNEQNISSWKMDSKLLTGDRLKGDKSAQTKTNTPDHVTKMCLAITTKSKHKTGAPASTNITKYTNIKKNSREEIRSSKPLSESQSLENKSFSSDNSNKFSLSSSFSSSRDVSEYKTYKSKVESFTETSGKGGVFVVTSQETDSENSEISRKEVPHMTTDKRSDDAAPVIKQVENQKLSRRVSFSVPTDVNQSSSTENINSVTEKTRTTTSFPQHSDETNPIPYIEDETDSGYKQVGANETKGAEKNLRSHSHSAQTKEDKGYQQDSVRLSGVEDHLIRQSTSLRARLASRTQYLSEALNKSQERISNLLERNRLNETSESGLDDDARKIARSTSLNTRITSRTSFLSSEEELATSTGEDRQTEFRTLSQEKGTDAADGKLKNYNSESYRNKVRRSKSEEVHTSKHDHQDNLDLIKEQKRTETAIPESRGSTPKPTKLQDHQTSEAESSAEDEVPPSLPAAPPPSLMDTATPQEVSIIPDVKQNNGSGNISKSFGEKDTQKEQHSYTHLEDASNEQPQHEITKQKKDRIKTMHQNKKIPNKTEPSQATSSPSDQWKLYQGTKPEKAQASNTLPITSSSHRKSSRVEARTTLNSLSGFKQPSSYDQTTLEVKSEESTTSVQTTPNISAPTQTSAINNHTHTRSNGLPVSSSIIKSANVSSISEQRKTKESEKELVKTPTMQKHTSTNWVLKQAARFEKYATENQADDDAFKAPWQKKWRSISTVVLPHKNDSTRKRSVGNEVNEMHEEDQKTLPVIKLEEEKAKQSNSIQWEKDTALQGSLVSSHHSDRYSSPLLAKYAKPDNKEVKIAQRSKESSVSELGLQIGSVPSVQNEDFNLTKDIYEEKIDSVQKNTNLENSDLPILDEDTCINSLETEATEENDALQHAKSNERDIEQPSAADDVSVADEHLEENKSSSESAELIGDDDVDGGDASYTSEGDLKSIPSTKTHDTNSWYEKNEKLKNELWRRSSSSQFEVDQNDKDQKIVDSNALQPQEGTSRLESAATHDAASQQNKSLSSTLRTNFLRSTLRSKEEAVGVQPHDDSYLPPEAYKKQEIEDVIDYSEDNVQSPSLQPTVSPEELTKFTEIRTSDTECADNNHGEEKSYYEHEENVPVVRTIFIDDSDTDITVNEPPDDSTAAASEDVVDAPPHTFSGTYRPAYGVDKERSPHEQHAGLGQCQQHGMMLQLYCKVCEEWVCDTCLVETHQAPQGKQCEIISAIEAVRHMKMTQDDFLRTRVAMLNYFRRELEKIIIDCERSILEHEYTEEELSMKLDDETTLLRGIRSMKSLAQEKRHEVDRWEELLTRNALRMAESSSSRQVVSAVEANISTVLANIMQSPPLPQLY